ncbi:MAG: hypothetical protein IJ853_03895 [Rickettsiales bacterium]|nr:hypothetical protein [Rickettsiales bacterium]
MYLADYVTDNKTIMSDKEKIKYSDVVRAVVEEKKYFKDAMDWYCVKYLNVTAERTYFILISVLSFLILIFLYFTIKNMLPLKEEFPVLIKRDNTVDYYTKISPIKPEGLNYNSNEAILRFLLINYTREMFTHNYKTGSIDDLNEKLTKIRNYSTNEVFQKFKNTFNQLSGSMFNKNVSQNVYIRSFRFIKQDKKSAKDKMKSYIFSTIPTEAEITYTTEFINESGERSRTNGKILLTFKYETIKYNSIKNEFTKPVLIITNYDIIGEKKDEPSN